MNTLQEYDRKQFLQPTVDAISTVLGLPSLVWLLDESRKVLRIAAAAQLLDESYNREAYLHLDEPCGAAEVFKTGQPLIVPNIESDERWKYKAELLEIGLRAAIVMPLWIKSKIVGILDVYVPEKVRFNLEKKKPAIESFATQISATLRQIQGLETVNVVGQLISSETQHSDRLLELIMQSAQQVIDCNHVSIFLIDKQNGDLKLEASSATDDITRRIFKKGEGLAGKVAEEGKALLVLNAREYAEFVEGQSKPDVMERSLLLVPIKTEDKVVGVISADMDGLNGFDEQDQMLIESLASQAAIAIYNAQIFEVAKIVNSSLDRKEVISLALTHLRDFIGYDSASIQVIQGDYRTFIGYSPYLPDGAFNIIYQDRSEFSPTSSIHDLRRNISQDSLIANIVQSQESIVIADTEQSNLWQCFPETAHVKSWIGVPFVVSGKVIGLLTLDHVTPGYYTQETGEQAAIFANLIATALLNTDLYQRERDKIQAFTQLHNLSHSLLAIEELPDTRRILESVAKSAKNVLKSDLIELYEYRQDQNKYELPPISVGERYEPFIPKEEIYADDAVFQLIHRPEPLYQEYAQAVDSKFTAPYKIVRSDQPKERFVVREKIQSTAAIPLRSGNESIGLMFANYRTPQTFMEEQRELIELFANQAAIAIQNARSYVQLYLVNQRQKALIEVGKELTSKLQLQEQGILELLGTQAQDALDIENLTIALYDEQTGYIRFVQATRDGKLVQVEKEPGWEPRQKGKGGKGKTDWIIEQKQPLLLSSSEEVAQWGFSAVPGITDNQDLFPNSWLGVPMIIRDQVVGVISTYHYEKDRKDRVFIGGKDRIFTKDDVQILRALADQATIAIDNARLYNYTQQKQIILIGLAQKLTSNIQLKEDEILQLIYKNASELMDTENMYIALYEEPTEKEPTGSTRFPLLYVDAKQIDLPPRKIDRGKKGRTEEIILTGQPIFIQTREESDKWYGQSGRQEFAGKPSASWIGVPMKLGEKMIGVVATYHTTKDFVYTQEDLDILQSMANLAAIALENAKLYSELKDAQGEIADRERELVMSGLAMDFAHKINNLAGTIPPWISLIKRRLVSENKEDSKVNEYLDKIIRDVSVMLKETHELRKPVAEPQAVNVEELIGSIVGQVEMVTSKDVQIIFQTEPNLSPVYCVEQQLATAIYGVIQNALKALAYQGTISIVLKSGLVEGKSVLQLDISDTGCGIPADQFESIFEYGKSYWIDKPGTGYGLWRTRNIIQSIAGNIKVRHNEIGKGTTFLITLPTIKPELHS